MDSHSLTFYFFFTAVTPSGSFIRNKLYPAVISAIEAGDQSPDVRVVNEVLERLDSQVQFTGLLAPPTKPPAGC